MKSHAEKKAFHVVSLILVVLFCLMHCPSSLLHPVCIEVDDSTLPKALGSQALTLYQSCGSTAATPARLRPHCSRQEGTQLQKPLGLEGPLILKAALQLEQLLPHIQLHVRVRAPSLKPTNRHPLLIGNRGRGDQKS